MSKRVWGSLAGAVVLFCAAVIVVMLRAPQSVTVPVDDLTELGGAMLGATACLVAARRHRGRNRWGWLLLALSALVWGAGQTGWTVYDLVLHQNPFPSAADAGYVGSVPLLVAGMLTLPAWPASLLARARALTDGLLISGGLLLISWNTVLTAVVASPSDSGLAQGLSLFYPISDVVVVTVLVTMISRAPRGSRSPLLVLIAGLGLLATADSTFAYLQSESTYGFGNFVDVGWTAGYLVVGLGALLSIGRPIRATASFVPSRAALLLPYLPVPLVVGLGVWERVTQSRVSTFTLAIGLAVFLIVILRQGLSVQENARLLRRLASKEAELHHRAEHDSLTNLLNRASFIRLVDEQLTTLRDDRVSAVLFVDLDDFKLINDSLGHAFGDDAIIAVGRRLLTCTRAGDLVGRLGGDEFAIFLRDLRDIGQLVTVAQRLIKALDEPFHAAEMQASVAGSIGVAIVEANDDAAELLRRADIAMYAAKANGKGLFSIFEPSMHTAMYQPLERRADLERALDADEMTLRYQPVVDTATRRPRGVEALVRWDHPQLGLRPPADFLGDAERAGLMVLLGGWVVRRACRDVMRMRRETELSDLFVSVNVSSSQLHDPGFIRIICDALDDSGLPPSSLVVELTEDVSVSDSDVVRDKLRRLRDMSVLVAIDDFGTGYAGFNYLRTMTVDALKVDKSFVDDLLGDGPHAALVEKLLDIGAVLGLATIAEGVETEAQHTALLRLGCAVAQGYFYGRPMTVDDFVALHSVGVEEVARAAAG